MSAKKHTQGTTESTLPALKFGSRVRCTDDGITGTITWANAVSVKIQWDDGELVTWRRDELPDKPLVILAADDEPRNEQPEPETQTAAAEKPAVTEPVEAVEPLTPVAASAAEQDNVTELQTMDAEITTVEQRDAAPAQEPASSTSEPTADARPALGIDMLAAAAPAPPKRARRVTTPTEPRVKKQSALDAAARVLAEAGAGQAMTCKEMIEVMAAKGYWTSPGGQTPDATLYSAILRELSVKGADARFQKTERGKFARSGAAS